MRNIATYLFLERVYLFVNIGIIIMNTVRVLLFLRQNTKVAIVQFNKGFDLLYRLKYLDQHLWKNSLNIYVSLPKLVTVLINTRQIVLQTHVFEIIDHFCKKYFNFEIHMMMYLKKITIWVECAKNSYFKGFVLKILNFLMVFPRILSISAL